MVNFGSMNQATADLLKKVSEQKKAEELQKEKEEIQTKLDVIEKNIEKLEDKKVAQTTTPAVGELPAPAKSKTLMYVGIVAGGIVVTYLLLKFSKKE